MENLISKIEKTKNCWNWKGEITSKGYGRASIKGKNHRAHRVVYEALVCQIAEGLELDHLCRNRLCVNPKHLEPVTHLENVRRSLPYRKQKEYCVNGHKFDESNIAKQFKGYGRICRICKNQRQVAYMKRKKATSSKDN